MYILQRLSDGLFYAGEDTWVDNELLAEVYLWRISALWRMWRIKEHTQVVTIA